MIFALVFVVSLILSLLLILVLRAGALKYGFVDIAKGDDLKIHGTPIPYIGGIALFVSITISVIVFYLAQSFPLQDIAGFLTASFVVFLLGLWDDIQWKHISSARPKLKLILLLFTPILSAFLLLYFSGMTVSLLSILVVALYIFVFINAVNYQDGMDGLVGGMTLISFLGFLFLSIIVGNIFAAATALIIIGGLAGFLFFNFPPARIFMGDSGAYLLGFYGAIFILLFSNFSVIQSVFGALLIMGVPLFEGIFTNLRRLAKGKSITSGDRDHTYDIFLKKGYSTHITLSIFYTLQLLLTIVGVWLIL
ncbi:MAG: undecaprenyl/decaprenyl-phosphate alpha-N-acetylglucosaminyl 1-phosphate transferase [Patescibacteria group bacterium]|nr:undecaprenyl/decaprenyl-phosphate alpha-N-acetylglucosaminyl 1-phosphate transferase [Patescibacteria group bacterium]